MIIIYLFIIYYCLVRAFRLWTNFRFYISYVYFSSYMSTSPFIYSILLHSLNTLTATRVFEEISVRPRVQQYQAFSARCSHRKLGIRLLLGIFVVNALTVYKIATRRNINIRIFRQLLVAKLFGLSENTKNPCLRLSWHNIAVRKNDSGRSIRRACKLCYANKRRRMDRTKAQKNLKKTTTYCPNCADQPRLCTECFKVLHSK